MLRDTAPPANILVVGCDQRQFAEVLEFIPTIAPYWTMQFCATGIEAIQRVTEDEDLDAIVTAFSLPDGPGLDVLRRVKDERPELARLLIDSGLNPNSTTEQGSVVHGIVDSSIEPVGFIHAVETATSLQRRLVDPALLRLLSDIDILPSPPQSVIELNELLQRPDVEIADVAHVVESDVALTAKLLRLVNSAFFGLGSHIANTGQAVAYLGLPTVRTLVSSLQLLNSLQSKDPRVSGAVEDIHAHSLAVADVARGYMPARHTAQDAYVAGMLHDVGLLALVTCAPVKYLALREEVQLGSRSLEACELDVVGATHAAIGAYVMQMWSFPSWIVDAVARSHDADELPEWSMDVTSAVFVAEQTVNLQKTTPSWEGGRLPPEPYLKALGLAELLQTDLAHLT